jgi:hypothetical protein
VQERRHQRQAGEPDGLVQDRLQDGQHQDQQQLTGDLVTRRYARNPDFVFRRIAGELILVPVRSTGNPMGSVYTLNEVGAAIWDLLDGKNGVEEVRDRLVEQFEVTPDVAEADVREFLARLASVRAVLPVEEQRVDREA